MRSRHWLTMARLVVAAALIAVMAGLAGTASPANAASDDYKVILSGSDTVAKGGTYELTVSLKTLATPTVATYSFVIDYGTAASFTFSTYTKYLADTVTNNSGSGTVTVSASGRSISATSASGQVLAKLIFTAAKVSATSTFSVRSVTLGDVIDSNGNSIDPTTQISVSSTKSVTITDTTSPTVTSVAASSAKGNSSPTFTVVFSKPVKAATSDFTVTLGAGITQGATAPEVAWASGTTNGGSGSTTETAQDGSGTGYTTYTFTVNLNGASTASGATDATSTVTVTPKTTGSISTVYPSSKALASTKSASYVLDTVKPTIVSLTGAAANPTRVNGSQLSASNPTPTFVLKLSEDVQASEVSNALDTDFSLVTPSGTSLSGSPVLSISPSTGNASSFTISADPSSMSSADGSASSTFTLRLANSAAFKDVAGNVSTAPSIGALATATYAYTLDFTDPTTGTLVGNDDDSTGAINTRTPSFTLSGASDAGGLNTLQLQRASSASGPWTNIGAVVAGTSTSTYSFAVRSTEELTDGTYYFRVQVNDKAGNVANSGAISKLINADRPTPKWYFKSQASGAATPSFTASDLSTTGYVKAGDDLFVQLKFSSLVGIKTFEGTPVFTIATGTYDFQNRLTGATGTFTVSGPAASQNGNSATDTFTWKFTAPSGTDVNWGGSITADFSNVVVTDLLDKTSLKTSTAARFYVDNTAPTFVAPSPVGGVYYADDTLRTSFVFSEAVKGATQSSFTSAPGSAAITGTPVLSVSSGCSNTITVDVSGIKGTGEASSTFAVLLNTTGTNITDCAGNALADRSSVATATFVLLSTNRPASAPASNSTSSDSGSSNNNSSGGATTKAPAAAAPVAPPAPAGLSGNAAVAQAYSALAPAKAQALVNGLGLVSPATVASLGATLGAVGGPTAAAFLDKVAGLPPVYLASVVNVTAAIPSQAAGALISALSTLSPAQMAAVGEMSAVLPPAEAAKVFGSIASLAQGGGVSFAPAAKLEKGARGDTLVFDLEDAGATAFDVEDSEVAGVQAATAQRTVVVLLKAGQVGRINRPKSGNWPNLAIPVTAGKQVGLTPIFSVAADATAFTFEPTPGNLNVVQQGSLGGGNVTPLSAPFAVTVSAPAGSKGTVGMQMPSIPVGDGNTFAYLYSTGGGTGAGFAGYLRAPAEFDPPTGRQKWSLSVGEASDVLILPVSLSPAYVQNFSETARIYSSSEDSAADFGVAGPQYTTFTVVAPQVRGRIYVYNPVTAGYGWINATEVGPSGAPKN